MSNINQNQNQKTYVAVNKCYECGHFKITGGRTGRLDYPVYKKAEAELIQYKSEMMSVSIIQPPLDIKFKKMQAEMFESVRKELEAMTPEQISEAERKYQEYEIERRERKKRYNATVFETENFEFHILSSKYDGCDG